MPAISGSRPAYVYYFMEAMTAAGAEMGLTRVVPGEGPRSARVYPMSERLSSQAAGLRLAGMRLACPQRTSRSALSSRIRPGRQKNRPFDSPMHGARLASPR